MELSKRLASIVSWIDQSVIADIGCDHALVCIEAVESKKADRAYACDLREGPLMQARSNIEQHGLQDRITTRLASGIHGLPDDVEQILICGMGGRLIEEILSADPLPASIRSLLLCPHKDAAHLRRFLLERGWTITQERVVHDQHFYPILKVVPAAAGEDSDPLSRLQDEESLLTGFHVQVDDDYRRCLAWQKKQWLSIRRTLPEDRREKMDHQLALLQRRIDRLEDENALNQGKKADGKRDL